MLCDMPHGKVRQTDFVSKNFNDSKDFNLMKERTYCRVGRLGLLDFHKKAFQSIRQLQQKNLLTHKNWSQNST